MRTTIKSIALLGLTIDFKLDDRTYLSSMAEFAKNFPNDTALPFLAWSKAHPVKQ